MRDDSRRSTATRRAVLGGLGGIATMRTVPAAGPPSPTVSVMTRNLYLGVDLFRLFEARSMEDVRRITGEVLADIERRPFPPRAAAIASEIASTGPDVVGVQEAALVRTQRPGDFQENPLPNASAVEVDFLEVLSSALADLGLDYQVAASVVTTDVELPADVEGERVDVRLADRDALLVREGVAVDGTDTGTYDAAAEVPVSGTTITIERGYCVADVAVGGAGATVATTHLESVAGDVRLRQARELLDALPEDRPVALGGDLNSGPGTTRDAYELLTESFDDAHATVHPDENAFTCCQASDLRNDRSQISRRIDAVLYAGLRPTAVERVGADLHSRVIASVEGESVHLWPSDHAGVVATFEVPRPTHTAREAEIPTPTSSPAPTLTPTRQPTRTTAPSEEERRDGEWTRTPPMAGFGVVLTVAAVLYAALARRRG